MRNNLRDRQLATSEAGPFHGRAHDQAYREREITPYVWVRPDEERRGFAIKCTQCECTRKSARH
jgi:hypothetical protein